MKKLQNSLFLLIMVAIVCAACGAKREPAPSNQGEAAETGTAAQSERTVKHLMGETKVPAAPRNIAALQPFIMDHLLALGIKPVAGIMFGERWPSFLADELQDTKVVGRDANPNLEAVLAANPDLIIAQNAQSKIYEELSKIAPAVIVDRNVQDWRDTFKEVAEIVGKQSKAQEVIQAFDTKAAEARTKLDAAIGNETVMFLRVTDKEFRYYGIKNYRILYEDLGLQPPKQFLTDDTNTYQAISMEKLPEINPDHIFLLSESEKKASQLTESAIWQNMTAVQNNQVYAVDYDLWFQGYGPVAYSKLIDETLQVLTKN